jgi:hypothetical protein
MCPVQVRGLDTPCLFRLCVPPLIETPIHPGSTPLSFGNLTAY